MTPSRRPQSIADRPREPPILVDQQRRFPTYDVFVDTAAVLLAAAAPTREPLALLVADVDHFRRIAAVCGEPYAADVLATIFELVRRNLRDEDMAAHPGGDEIVMLLRAPATLAREVAERLCAAVRGHQFPETDHGPGPRVTISVGIAAAPEHGSSFSALHAAADGARVRLKAQGRDGSAVAPLPHEDTFRRPLAIDRFAGRAEERRSLVQWLDEALAGRPSVVAVLGEAGTGTGALVRQLGPQIRLSGGSLVAGRCRDAEVRAPYGVWTSLLEALHRLPDAPRRAWRELPHLVPALGEPDDASAGSKYRLLGEIAEYVRLAARVRPLVLVLDEMQWADAGSWDALDHVVRQLADEPVLMCVTMRSEPAFSEAAERRAALESRDRWHDLPVSRLTREDVKRWLEAAFHHQEIGREFLAFLYRHTEGRPLLIVQLLRTLVEEGAVRHTGERWEWTPVSELRLPTELAALVSRRLARFSASTLAVLSTAAIIGDEFDTSLVVAAGAGSEPAVQLALSEALSAGIIELAYARGMRTYAFTHGSIADILVSSLAPERLRQVHERVAEGLERRDERRIFEIALHHDQAGENAKAYAAALRAAAQAERVYAHDAARAFLNIAARDATTPADLAEVRVRLASLAELVGRFDETEELCDLAIEWFDGQGDRARALILRRMRQRARRELGEPAQKTLEAVLALDDEAKALGLTRERVSILMMLSHTYARLGDRAAAERIAEECVRMAEALQDDTLLAEALNRLANSLDRDAVDRAIVLLQRALALFERAGDVRGQARSHINLGAAAHLASRWAEAERAYATALALGRAAGMVDLWGNAALNLGVLAQQSGDYDRAREILGEGLALVAAVKHSAFQLYALYNMAHLDQETGASERGAELYEATSSLAKRIGAADVEIGATAGAGLCRLDLGRVDEARAAKDEVERMLHGQAGDWFQGRELVEALRTRLLVLDGRLREALAQFEHAMQIVDVKDLYAAAWLTAACAPSLFEQFPEQTKGWIRRYADRVEALGYRQMSKRYFDLLAR